MLHIMSQKLFGLFNLSLIDHTEGVRCHYIISTGQISSVNGPDDIHCYWHKVTPIDHFIVILVGQGNHDSDIKVTEAVFIVVKLLPRVFELLVS